MEFHSRTAHASRVSAMDPQNLEQLIADIYLTLLQDKEGEVSSVYPALERVDPSLFGICIRGVDGSEYAIGDVETDFTIMSISKPYIFALVCQATGPQIAREKLGVNGTGMPFNSVSAIEYSESKLTNPMVNSGAIATTSFTPGKTQEEKWQYIYRGLCGFAGRALSFNQEIYTSARETNYRNRGIANLLYSYGLLGCDPETATDLYTRQCCLNINARDLAVMGATLADGGINPLTGDKVINNNICHYTLSVMVTSGMYENSGEWLYETGLPAKSGIGGGIIAVSPGRGGLSAFAPRLDSAGNSIKAQKAIRALSRHLGMNLLVSTPYQDRTGTTKD